MTLEDLGYDSEQDEHRNTHELVNFEVGRVTAEHKERYVVKTAEREYDAEVIGNLRYTAESRVDLPAVGDWVAISEYDTDKVLIHAVYPRKSMLQRQAAGKTTDRQVIATNVDYGLIVLSVNRDFSINRLQRYMAICHSADVEPVVLLNKIDLIEEESLQEMLDLIRERIQGITTIPLSMQTGAGLNQLNEIITRGHTYCLLGSSGVGKSTLLNRLIGGDIMVTREISEAIDRGKHTTSHRELFVLESGGIIIDNPGMREVGMTELSDGLGLTFDDINHLSENCRFKDCSHTSEAGCAVIEAVENGEIDHESYENWLKMERERAHYEANVEERRRKDKQFGKMVRNVKNLKQKNKL